MIWKDASLSQLALMVNRVAQRLANKKTAAEAAFLRIDGTGYEAAVSADPWLRR